MLVVSLLVHFQHCVKRYQTRKGLASLTSQQMTDIGMTKERQKLEISPVSIKGFMHDLLGVMKVRRRLS